MFWERSQGLIICPNNVPRSTALDTDMLATCEPLGFVPLDVFLTVGLM